MHRHVHCTFRCRVISAHDKLKNAPSNEQTFIVWTPCTQTNIKITALKHIIVTSSKWALKIKLERVLGTYFNKHTATEYVTELPLDRRKCFSRTPKWQEFILSATFKDHSITEMPEINWHYMYMYFTLIFIGLFNI